MPIPDLTEGLLVPLQLQVRGHLTHWYNTLAAFGNSLDVTLQEIVIESLLPADEATARFASDLAQTG